LRTAYQLRAIRGNVAVNTLDLLIIAVVFALALLGYAQGFIIGAASLIGLGIGGVVGTRVSHAILDRGSDASSATWAPIIGLVIGLLITLIGAMAMQDLAAELRVRVATYENEVVDHVLGAVLLGIVGLVLAWFAATAAIGVPQLRSLRPQLVDSSIISKLNSTLPPAGPLLGAIASYDPFPTFDGGRITAAPPDVNLPRDLEVREAAKSVVRIVGTACGYQVTGSGWVASDGYVITNAHVVAGESDTGVEVRGGGEAIDADIVAFDEVNDLAVLRVSNLGLAALGTIGEPKPETAAVVLGFPENRGFTATPARFSDSREVRGKDVYGRKEVIRDIASFRGVVRHGNSGGPLVDEDGKVLATVFASTVGEKIRGGYGIPNSIVLKALAIAKKVPQGYGVRTGRCVG